MLGLVMIGIDMFGRYACLVMIDMFGRYVWFGKVWDGHIWFGNILIGGVTKYFRVVNVYLEIFGLEIFGLV